MNQHEDTDSTAYYERRQRLVRKCTFLHTALRLRGWWRAQLQSTSSALKLADCKYSDMDLSNSSNASSHTRWFLHNVCSALVRLRFVPQTFKQVRVRTRGAPLSWRYSRCLSRFLATQGVAAQFGRGLAQARLFGARPFTRLSQVRFEKLVNTDIVEWAVSVDCQV